MSLYDPSCLVQGLLYAYNLSHLLRTLMNLHVDLRRPMTRTSVLALCHLAEVLKAVEHTFHRRSMLVAESINHIVQHLSFIVLAAIGTAKVTHLIIGGGGTAKVTQ